MHQRDVLRRWIDWIAKQSTDLSERRLPLLPRHRLTACRWVESLVKRERQRLMSRATRSSAASRPVRVCIVADAPRTLEGLGASAHQTPCVPRANDVPAGHQVDYGPRRRGICDAFESGEHSCTRIVVPCARRPRCNVERPTGRAPREGVPTTTRLMPCPRSSPQRWNRRRRFIDASPYHDGRHREIAPD